MDCPRCGVPVFVDSQHCRDCGWQLSRPFLSSSSLGASPTSFETNGSARAIIPPSIQTAADALVDSFAVAPPARRQRRGRGRRRRGKRADRSDNGHGVAVLPEEALEETPPRLEIIEMPELQSSFDFPTAELEAEQWAARTAAPVGVRCRAGLMDAALIVSASGLFFGLFALLGGHVGLARYDLLIYLVAALALASLYFGLFTLLGGRTPGMLRYHLQVVTFDGRPLAPPRALWRAFGYVVSTGSLLLGFCWAGVDERHLAWHDHISQTFITDRPVDD